MLGEILAYYAGKEAGRGERPRRRRPMTVRDIRAWRVTTMLIVLLMIVVVLLGSK